MCKVPVFTGTFFMSLTVTVLNIMNMENFSGRSWHEKKIRRTDEL